MMAFSRLLEAGVLKPGSSGVEEFAAHWAGAVDARGAEWLGWAATKMKAARSSRVILSFIQVSFLRKRDMNHTMPAPGARGARVRRPC
jgi:hypothetical protein